MSLESFHAQDIWKVAGNRALYLVPKGNSACPTCCFLLKDNSYSKNEVYKAIQRETLQTCQGFQIVSCNWFEYPTPDPSPLVYYFKWTKSTGVKDSTPILHRIAPEGNWLSCLTCIQITRTLTLLLSVIWFIAIFMQKWSDERAVRKE